MINVDFSCPSIIMWSSNCNICMRKKSSLCDCKWLKRTQIRCTRRRMKDLQMSLDWCPPCSPLPARTSSVWSRLDGQEWRSANVLPCWCRHIQLPQCLCPSCRNEGLPQLCPAIFTMNERFIGSWLAFIHLSLSLFLSLYTYHMVS